MNTLNVARITKIAADITNLQRRRGNKDWVTTSEVSSSTILLPDNSAQTEIMLEAKAAAIAAATAIFDKRVPEAIARLEAELKGEICPIPEPAPDAYLEPITAAFGEHCGLNADWAAMAWRVAGSLCDGTWIVDDESPSETVSLVTCKQDDGDPAIVTICTGTVEQILPIAKRIAEQVQHG